MEEWDWIGIGLGLVGVESGRVVRRKKSEVGSVESGSV